MITAAVVRKGFPSVERASRGIAFLGTVNASRGQCAARDLFVDWKGTVASAIIKQLPKRHVAPRCRVCDQTACRQSVQSR